MPTCDIPSFQDFVDGESSTVRTKLNTNFDNAEAYLQGLEDRLEESLSALHVGGVVWKRPEDVADLIVSAGTGLSVNLTAGEALIGYLVAVEAKANEAGNGITNGATNYCYLMQDGTLYFNIDGVPPTSQRNILLAEVTAAGGVVTVVDNYADGVVRGIGQPSLRAFSCTATEAVGDAVYVSAGNTVSQAQSDDGAPAKARVVGIILAKETSTSCIVATDGAVVGGFTGLTTGSAYYLQTTAGELDTGKPTAPDPIVPVGIAVSTTAMLVKVFLDEAQISGGGGGAHATTHAVGGSDPLTGNLDSNGRLGIRRNDGGTTYKRRRVNLVEGSGIQIGISDDGTNEEVDVSIAATLPVAHEAQHESGGVDELPLDVLAGNLTNAQHGSLTGGDHEGDLTGNARLGVRKNSGGSTYKRRRMNLIEGANVTLTVADDSGDEEVDVTIAASGGGGGGALADLSDVDDDLLHTAGFVLRADGNEYTGQQLTHGDLADDGTNTHAEIDDHIADTSIHTEDAELVHKTGDETIAGLKTFTTMPQSSDTPSENDDLVNLAYLATFSQGLIPKEACRVATTAAGTLATDFENGDTIDGVTLATNDRILIKNQADAKTNGIYTVNASGAPTRVTDYDASAEVQEGTFTYISAGTANAGKQFVQTTVDPVLGSDNLVFVFLNQPSTYTASNGIKLVGADIRSDPSDTNPALEIADGGIRVKVDDASIERTAGGLAVKAVAGSLFTLLPNIPAGAGKVPTVNLGGAGAAVNKFLRGDQTWGVPSASELGATTLNYTKALTTDTTQTTVASTAAETTFFSYTVPGGTLGTNKVLRLVVVGQYLNNSGSNKTLTVRVKYGGAQFVGRVSGSIGNNAATGNFCFVILLAAAGATNQQQGYINCSVESGADVSVDWTDRGRVSIDSTVNQTLLMTVQHSASGALLSISTRLAHIELLNASDDIGVGLHVASHQDGGVDEINVAGLSGELADAQTPKSHVHAASDVTSGTLDGDRLPALSTTKKGGVPATGTPAGKYLKDDGTWATPTAGGDMLKSTYDTDNDGKVDTAEDAEKLGGSLPAAYETVANREAASGYAGLDTNSKVIKDPANATATPTASKIVIADAGGKVDGWVSAASDTVPGKVELATAAEINTGTDTGRAPSVDALAGSNFGIRVVDIKVIADGTALATGDGQATFVVPAEFNGMNLVSCGAHVFTVSSSGLPTIQIRNQTDTQDMLSTRITIDASEKDSATAATAAVIDTAHDDVATGDEIAIDVDVSGTGTKGLEVRMGFQLP